MTDAPPTAQPAWKTWTGRVLSALPLLLMAMGVASLLFNRAQAAQGMAKFGWQESALTLILTLEIGSALLYIFPRTAVLGAILMTAYFGGAVATHLRVADPGWPLAVICGILTWLGLYLRDPRLRALVPLRQPQITK
jgi:DoxX-like protein